MISAKYRESFIVQSSSVIVFSLYNLELIIEYLSLHAIWICRFITIVWETHSHIIHTPVCDKAFHVLWKQKVLSTGSIIWLIASPQFCNITQEFSLSSLSWLVVPLPPSLSIFFFFFSLSLSASLPPSLSLSPWLWLHCHFFSHQNPISFSSLVIIVWWDGLSPSSILSFHQALPEQPACLLWSHCNHPW